MDHSKAIYRQIGARICSKRSALKMSQATLAREVLLTRASISNIEKGRQKILVHTLLQIASALKVTLQELVPDMNVNINVAVDRVVTRREHRDWVDKIVRGGQNIANSKKVR